ncbi:MAG: pyridoxal-phosphate dependent enzyme [Bacteroidetes bacterium]|nr:pyridoxal-phosphate dependent enzyme [Bacteroidota bacterium]MBV6461941.1 hypothetical protein [Flavobacteriales bacterium]WKZ74508.1 MAG: pyridoxal-phosphate dependent enzyme [Vicingaceae bacterium]MCL4816239.1 pyridoxal-phosphate dependent enzyme [Flavobacteriales bacterium]NOG95122.1 pyridoxal-phosphate dependent enzyme [Bacteroidota bacterium]
MLQKIPIQKIETELTERKKVSLKILRIDLVHPEISGNKWFKMKYNLAYIKQHTLSGLLTFGGAYSNHIAATAYAGKLYHINTIGIIRGEEVSNPTLTRAKELGMQLHFVSRSLFREKDKLNLYLQKKFNLQELHVIPEGGSNLLGVKGCEEIAAYIPASATHVCCACGTGSTVAGILKGCGGKQKVIGISSLKALGYFEKMLVQYGIDEILKERIFFSYDYHFGGYAKLPKPLYLFAKEFSENYSVPLDYVYTSKMLYGVMDLIGKDYFPPASEIVAVHTGGLQGNIGFEHRIASEFK